MDGCENAWNLRKSMHRKSIVKKKGGRMELVVFMTEALREPVSPQRISSQRSATGTGRDP